jgi:hypothetical protein
MHGDCEKFVHNFSLRTGREEPTWVNLAWPAA